MFLAPVVFTRTFAETPGTRLVARSDLGLQRQEASRGTGSL